MVASTSGATTRVSHLTTTSVALSLLSWLIHTRIVGVIKTFNAITIGGLGPSSLVTKSYTSLFTFGIPLWTPMALASTTSQLIFSSTPIMSGVPPNPFNPFLFRMTHILQLVPSIGSGYMPLMSYAIYSMPTHLGFGGFGCSLPESGGYSMIQYFNPSSINMPRGNAIGVVLSAQPISSKWGTRAFPEILFLATLNIPYFSKLMNKLVVHIPH